MPNHDITFCSKEGNKCRRRLKCYRFTAKHGEKDLVWYSDFFLEFGQQCEQFKKAGP